jgi:hypothetical protein
MGSESDRAGVTTSFPPRSAASKRPPSARAMEADAALEAVTIDTKDALDRIKKLAAEVLSGSGEFRAVKPSPKK